MITIKDKENCTGCHGCFNICPQNCITMENDFEGFWYPQVDKNKCTNCGLCTDVCPILHKKTPEDRRPKSYACKNKNMDTRLGSSSGGIFSIIAEKIIDRGGVIFGAEFDDNLTVKHSFITSKEDLYQFRGSKYVQSKIGDTYKRVKSFLNQQKEVLFSGTPCQIGGLKSYLGKSYDNLFCIDIICHGVPSTRVFEKYLTFQENNYKSSIKSINFRSKRESWRNYEVSIEFSNKKTYQKKVDQDYYMITFLKDICLRPSCYHCNYKNLDRQSDITLADFWGIENILPELDDDKGTSLLFVHTAKGNTVINDIKEKIDYKEVDLNQALIYNQSAIKSVKPNTKRDLFFADLDQLSFDRLTKKYCSDNLKVTAKKIGKKILHTIKGRVT